MRFWRYTFIFLFLIVAVIFIALFQFPDKNMHIIACDVGQGDGILITYGTIQILTDGGPDDSVLDCMGKYMPFWDRKVELAILTHPDSDHLTGMIAVLGKYKVDKLLINPIDPGTPIYQVLKNVVGGVGVDVVNPTPGMKMKLGLLYLDILGPTDELINSLTIETSKDKFSKYSFSKDANLYSIVYLLKFRNFKGLLTGDIPPSVSDNLSVNYSVSSVEYIKIPHHGSINGITKNLLNAAKPEIGVISVGKNKWGHPRQEVLDMLSEYGVKTFRTDEMGDVIISTDGNNYWLGK